MQIYEWEFLAVRHHPNKFWDHKHCDSGDIMFLICHKRLCEFMCENSSRWVTTCASGYIKYLIFDVNSQIHVIEGSNNFINGSSSWSVTSLSSLVALGVVVVEM